jgi:hypothetical protein
MTVEPHFSWGKGAGALHRQVRLYFYSQKSKRRGNRNVFFEERFADFLNNCIFAAGGG